MRRLSMAALVLVASLGATGARDLRLRRGYRDRPGYAGRMAASASGAVDQAQTETAGFGRRLGALLIDWALCTLVASLLVDDLRANPWPQLGVFVVVNAFFVGLFGQNPGMWLTRIRCISVIDGGGIGLPRAILRALLLALVIPAVVSDGDGRGLHDRAAHSIMIRRA